MAQPLIFSPTVQPINIAPTGHNSFARDVTIIGWGIWDVETQEIAPVLQHATVPLLSQSECERVTLAHDVPIYSTLCTGPIEGGFGGCNGDSGGPMIQETANGEYIQVGVAAWAIRPCGAPEAPTGYVEVSDYNTWIRQSIGEL